MPAWLIPLILGSAAAASTAGSMIDNSKNRRLTEAERAKDREADLAARTQTTAANESLADPFRHQADQINAIKSLDRTQFGTYNPVQPGGFSLMGKYPVPTYQGGYSYQPSQDVRDAAGALKTSVMAGQGAPTMTTPANYGKTGALDLISLLASDDADPNASLIERILRANARAGARRVDVPPVSAWHS